MVYAPAFVGARRYENRAACSTHGSRSVSPGTQVLARLRVATTAMSGASTTVSRDGSATARRNVLPASTARGAHASRGAQPVEDGSGMGRCRYPFTAPRITPWMKYFCSSG